MDIEERKTVDMLTKDSVSVLTQKFINIEGENVQVGANHRISYVNSQESRTQLQDEQPEDVVNAIMIFWGDTPSIIESNIHPEDNE